MGRLSSLSITGCLATLAVDHGEFYLALVYATDGPVFSDYSHENCIATIRGPQLARTKFVPALPLRVSFLPAKHAQGFFESSWQDGFVDYWNDESRRTRCFFPRPNSR
jgi:hypothetical protein